MKNIKYLALALFSLTLVNCTNEDDNGQVKYNGTSFINFLNQGTEQQVIVVSDTEYTDIDLKVGTLLPVSGNQTVKIIPIEIDGGAISPLDYEILNDTDVIEDGATEASFKLRFFKSGAVQAGKKVSFRLETALPLASFNTIHTINVRLTCPIEALVGTFRSNTYWYNQAEAFHTIEQPVTLDQDGNPIASTQIIIRNFFYENTTPPPANSTIAGSDLLLSYDKNTFEIIGNFSFPTGRYDNGVQIRAVKNPLVPSFFDPCTRKVTVNISYRRGPSTVIENATEVFTGVPNE